MADITTHDIVPERRGGIAQIFAVLARWMVRIAESDRRVRQVEFLRNLSDEELAARGLKRENIAHHVFGDLYYL
ncbi:MAG: DUF1127 domain-containing protein [Paracoccaceae bacterium]